MSQSLRFHSGRTVALLLALVIGPQVVAQTTDEWTVTSWVAPSHDVAESVRFISSAGKGHYVMASQLQVYSTSVGGRNWSSILQSPDQFQFTFVGVAHPSRGVILAL